MSVDQMVSKGFKQVAGIGVFVGKSDGAMCTVGIACLRARSKAMAELLFPMQTAKSRCKSPESFRSMSAWKLLPPPDANIAHFKLLLTHAFNLRYFPRKGKVVLDAAPQNLFRERCPEKTE